MTNKTQHVELKSELSGIRFTLSGSFPITWKLKTGGFPFRGVVYLTDTQDSIVQLQYGMESRWSLIFRFGKQAVEFSNLFLVQRGRVVQGGFVSYTLVDRRYVIAGVRVDADFNRLRTRNGFVRPSGFLTPKNLGFFRQVRAESFVGYTLRNPTDTSFAQNLQSLEATAGVPWTAFEALKYLLSLDHFASRQGIVAPDGRSFLRKPPIVAQGVKDNGYILKNWNPRGSLGNAINQLSRLAHVVVALAPDGSFVIASAEPDAADAQLSQFGWYVGSGGIPTVVQSQTAAPHLFRLYFTTKREHRFEHDEFFDRTYVHPDPKFDYVNLPGVPVPVQVQNSIQPPLTNQYDRRVFDAVPNDVFWLEQVIRMPQDTTNLQKGQWACVQDAYNEWNAEKHILPVKAFRETAFPFSYDTFQEYPEWASAALATLILRDRTRIGFRNPVLNARASAMYTTRKYLRIPEILTESIVSIDNNLSSIFATSTRSRVKSPVWCDYVAWDSVIRRELADSSNIDASASGKGFIRNVPLHDPNDPRYAKAKNLEDIAKLHAADPAAYPVFDVYQRDPDIAPGPFELYMVENSRGVITLDAPPDLFGETYTYNLGLVDPATVPVRELGGLSATGNLMVNSMNLTPNFRMFTVLAIEWRTPNDARRSYYQEIRGKDVLTGAIGPLFEQKYEGYDVYQVYEPGVRPEWNETRGVVTIKHNGPIGNEDVATDITQGEAFQHYYRYRPHIIGVFARPGVDVPIPYGSVTESGIVAQGGKVETVMTAEKPPMLPPVVAGFEPNVKEIIQRLPPGAGG